MTTQVTRASVVPGLGYRDAPAAIDWLERVLGFRVTALFREPDGAVAYAQLSWGSGAISLSTRPERPRLPETGPSSIALTADDAAAVDRHYERALAAGAEVLLPVEDTFYGSHGFSLRDPEGNLWHVGTPHLETEVSRSLPQRVI